eukprot:91368-Pelagomonas_calceolata.AAC.1
MKFRLREAQQERKKTGSATRKESRMITERLEFQTFNNKQSQHCQPFNQGKPSWHDAQQLSAEHN